MHVSIGPVVASTVLKVFDVLRIKPFRRTINEGFEDFGFSINHYCVAFLARVDASAVVRTGNMFVQLMTYLASTLADFNKDRAHLRSKLKHGDTLSLNSAHGWDRRVIQSEEAIKVIEGADGR